MISGSNSQPRVRISMRNHIRISFDFCMTMLFLMYVFCPDLTFAFFAQMATQQSRTLSQIVSLSLPDPADGTLRHHQGIPLRSGPLEEAAYTGGLAVEEVVGWAKGLATPTQLIHVDMRTPKSAGRSGEKGWATQLFRELRVALPGLRAVWLIPAGSTVDSLLGIMSMHTVGKPKPGLCAIYPATGLVHYPMRMDMVAINNYFPAGEPRADHSNVPFEWQAMQGQWWDDLGILPNHPTVPPLHHIPYITLPTLHRMQQLSWYRGIADPPPPSLRLSPPPPPPPGAGGGAAGDGGGAAGNGGSAGPGASPGAGPQTQAEGGRARAAAGRAYGRGGSQMYLMAGSQAWKAQATKAKGELSALAATARVLLSERDGPTLESVVPGFQAALDNHDDVERRYLRDAVVEAATNPAFQPPPPPPPQPPAAHGSGTSTGSAPPWCRRANGLFHHCNLQRGRPVS